MNEKKDFMKTEGGNFLITAIACVIIWGITVTLFASGSDFSIIVILLCAYFGWQALNCVQPSMFIWMPIAGWIIYFCIKFMLSAVVGTFVAPFVIGKKIGRSIHDSL